jgi:hypothetical protein
MKLSTPDWHTSSRPRRVDQDDSQDAIAKQHGASCNQKRKRQRRDELPGPLNEWQSVVRRCINFASQLPRYEVSMPKADIDLFVFYR